LAAVQIFRWWKNLGSGCLVDLSEYGIKRTNCAPEYRSLAFSLVTFSGDKIARRSAKPELLPEKEELVHHVRRHPLFFSRACAWNKLTIHRAGK